MRRRLSWLGLPEDHAVQASVLELPFEDATFDYVYSIGCLHHTGDLERSVAGGAPRARRRAAARS